MSIIVCIYLNKCQLPMCYLKYMEKHKTHTLFKSTNISLLRYYKQKYR